MDVVIVLVFISLILVAAALAFFMTRLRGGDFDHGDRLSLLPLLDDDGRPVPPPPDPEETTEEDATAHGSH